MSKQQNLPKELLEKRLKVFSTENYHLGFITDKPSDKIWQTALSSLEKSGVITTRVFLPYYLLLIFDDVQKQKDFEHELLQMELPIARAEKNRLVVNLKSYIDLLQYKLPVKLVADKFLPAIQNSEIFADVVNYQVQVKNVHLANVISISQTAEKELVVVETSFPEVLQRTSLCTYMYEKAKNGVKQKFYAIIRGLETTLHTLGIIAATRFGKKISSEFNQKKSQIISEIQSKIGGVRKPKEVSEVLEDPKEAVELLKDLL